LDEVAEYFVELRVKDHLTDIHTVEGDISGKYFQSDFVVVHDVIFANLAEVAECGNTIQ
jgi:hypothetical protein